MYFSQIPFTETNIHHDANFLITGGIGGCHNNNLLPVMTKLASWQHDFQFKLQIIALILFWKLKQTFQQSFKLRVSYDIFMTSFRIHVSLIV